MRSPWTATSASRTASGMTTLPFLIRRSNTAASLRGVSSARQRYYAYRDGGKRLLGGLGGSPVHRAVQPAEMREHLVQRRDVRADHLHVEQVDPVRHLRPVGDTLLGEDHPVVVGER